jgi:excinuclease UvrABC nuclease subunit
MIDYSSIPMSSGVYHLYDGDECVYVGSSRNMHRRVKNQRQKKVFTRVDFYVCPVNEMAKREQTDIRRIKPKLNKAYRVYERVYCDRTEEHISRYRQLHLYIPHDIFENLEKAAMNDNRTVSNLALFLLCEALKARGVQL